MKSLLALTLLAAVCAAARIEPLVLSDAELQDAEIEKVAVLLDQDLQPAEDIRVHVVDINPGLFEAEQKGEAALDDVYSFSPDELENIRINLPEGFDPNFLYRDDPMLR